MIAGEVSVSPARQQRETAVAFVDDTAAAPGEPDQDAGRGRRGAARKRPRRVKSPAAVPTTEAPAGASGVSPGGTVSPRAGTAEAAAEPGGDPSGGKHGGGRGKTAKAGAPPAGEPGQAHEEVEPGVDT